MAFEITDWNLEPNQEWYVRLFDNTSGIGVGLYETLADANAQTNVVASFTTSGFGSGKEVTFVSTSVSLFQDVYTWHLKVSGTSGTATRVLRIKQFVDLEDVDHPIFRNESLVTIRAGASIDSHTYAVIRYLVDTGVHYPELETGDIVMLVSSRRGLSKTVQVVGHDIEYNMDDTGQASLVSKLTVTEYMALNR